MQKDGVSVTEISALSLYSQVHSLRAFCLSIILLSLAGLPPLVGFFGKLFIFRSAVDAGFVSLAIVGGLSSVIGAFYYLRLVYLIYFGQINYELGKPMPMINRVTLISCAAAMILGSINLFGLQSIIETISINFLS